MVAYVDSSVVLRYILTGEIVMKHVAEFPRVVSSELLELSVSVKKRAIEAFPVQVKTLDALHLASAPELLTEINAADVSVFSHDHTLNLCARALGFRAVLLRA